MDKIFQKNGFSKEVDILDCACGIGTQAIGLARLGYQVTALDISEGALGQARDRAKDADVKISFKRADFRDLSKTFEKQYDIVLAMDNALPHMLTEEDLKKAVESIVGQMREKGIFVGSIRDYDALLQEKPSYAPPYIYQTEGAKRVSFQTWDWEGVRYKLTQYIIEDGTALSVSKFECAYRGTRREELTNLFSSCGCRSVTWLFPKETGFYQPIIVAMK